MTSLRHIDPNFGKNSHRHGPGLIRTSKDDVIMKQHVNDAEVISWSDRVFKLRFIREDIINMCCGLEKEVNPSSCLMAWVCFILNIIPVTSGIGTMVNSILYRCSITTLLIGVF